MDKKAFLFYYIPLVTTFLVHRTGSSKVDIAYDVFIPPDEKIVNLPPIIFLHGFLDSKRSWKYVAEPLSEKTGRTVYTLDARNHGKSPWTAEFNMDVMVEDLDNFLSDHNISEAILAGHSMGGRAVQAFALRQPNKVEKLIIEEMSMTDLTQVPDAAIGFLMKFLKKALIVIPPNSDDKELLKNIRKYFQKIPKGVVPERAFDLALAPVNLGNGSFTWQANLDVLEERAYEGALGITLTGTYEKDALFLYGTKSFLKIYDDKQIKDYFPKAEMLGFNGGTHLIHHQFPEDFVREVTRFITGLITSPLQC